MSRRTRIIHEILKGVTFAAAYVGTTAAIGYVLVRHAILKGREAVETMQAEDDEHRIAVYVVEREPTVDDRLNWN